MVTKHFSGRFFLLCFTLWAVALGTIETAGRASDAARAERRLARSAGVTIVVARLGSLR